MVETLQIAVAEPGDATALRALHALSFRTLGASAYAPETIETYLAEVPTLDDHLLQDGHYRMATIGGALVGCGGWSTRPAGYGARASAAYTVEPGAATVRAVYVHPDWARRGIAARIMAEVEADMVAAGFGLADVHSTLSGLSFYRRLGYRISGGTVPLQLSGGRVLEVVGMHKLLGAHAMGTAA